MPIPRDQLVVFDVRPVTEEGVPLTPSGLLSSFRARGGETARLVRLGTQILSDRWQLSISKEGDALDVSWMSEDEPSTATNIARFDSESFARAIGRDHLAIAGRRSSTGTAPEKEGDGGLQAALFDGKREKSACRLQGDSVSALEVSETPFRILVATTNLASGVGDSIFICDETGRLLNRFDNVGIVQRMKIVAGSVPAKALIQTVISYSLIDLRSANLDWEQLGRLRLFPGNSTFALPSAQLLFAVDTPPRYEPDDQTSPTNSPQLLALDLATGELASERKSLPELSWSDKTALYSTLSDHQLVLHSGDHSLLADWRTRKCENRECRTTPYPDLLWSIPRYDDNSAIVYWCDEPLPAPSTATFRRIPDPPGATTQLSLPEQPCLDVIDDGRCGEGLACHQVSDSPLPSPGPWRYQRQLQNQWSSQSNSISLEHPAFPIAGSFWVLHSYGTSNRPGMAHMAVDLVAPSASVRAARGGYAMITSDASGDTGISINVVESAAYMVEDAYGHIAVSSHINNGDPVSTGDYLGSVRTNYFNGCNIDFCHHMHWQSDRNPILDLPRGVTRDTHGPALGNTLRIVAKTNGKSSCTLQRARGDVALSVEAYDLAGSAGSLPKQKIAPFALGFWITTAAGSRVLGSAQQPIWLFNFGQNYCPQHPATCNSKIILEAMDDSQPRSILGMSEVSTYWILTNTAGAPGTAANISSSSYWRTDARDTGVPYQLGTAVPIATTKDEALFPDGDYQVHVRAVDAMNTGVSVEKTYSLTIDNWSPQAPSCL